MPDAVSSNRVVKTHPDWQAARRAGPEPDARFAIDMFRYSARKQIACHINAMQAVFGKTSLILERRKM